MQLSQQQRDFFETYGYLVLPGLLSEELEWIIEEFEAVFVGRGVVHDGSKRSTVVPFMISVKSSARCWITPRSAASFPVWWATTSIISGAMVTFTPAIRNGTATAGMTSASLSRLRSIWTL